MVSECNLAYLSQQEQDRILPNVKGQVDEVIGDKTTTIRKDVRDSDWNF